MTNDVTVADAPEPVQDAAPSCKLVWLLLAREGPMTFSELVEETMLAERTARWARVRLEDAGVVSSRSSFRDARKDVFSVSDA